MKNQKHTPGPWKRSENHIFSQSEGNVICRFEADEIDLEANARLIAAAPDLLLQLQDAVAALKEYQQYSEAMRSRGFGFHPNFHGWSPTRFIENLASTIRKATGGVG